MNQKEIDEIKARCDKATPGPWDDKVTAVYKDGTAIRICSNFSQFETDAFFVAQARQDIPALLAEVEQLNGYIEIYKGLCDKHTETNLALISEVKRLKEAQRWIPVSERLPDSEDTVEAYSPTFGIFDAYCKNKVWYTRGHDIWVTHWRIPEPPKEGNT